MLDQEFCEFLAYELSKAFGNSNNELIKGFWCDGVLLNQSDSHYSQKFVNDNRQVILKAFIGNDGQTEYELTLKFGSTSLSRYARSLDMKETIPNSGKSNWFDIDTKLKKIEVQLD